MNTLRKLIVAVVGLFVAISISVIVMIYGWGLEPKNWSVIIFVYFFGQLFAQMLMALATAGDKDA